MYTPTAEHAKYGHFRFIGELAKAHPSDWSYERLTQHIGEDPDHLAAYRAAMQAKSPAEHRSTTPALERLNALATERAKADGIDFHVAYTQVLATPQGQALYGEYLLERGNEVHHA
jgi:hypothetical protein